VHWGNISAHQHLSMTFIEKHFDDVDWEEISVNKYIGEEMLREYSFDDNSFNMRRKELLKYVIFDLITLIAQFR